MDRPYHISSVFFELQWRLSMHKKQGLSLSELRQYGRSVGCLLTKGSTSESQKQDVAQAISVLAH